MKYMVITVLLLLFMYFASKAEANIWRKMELGSSFVASENDRNVVLERYRGGTFEYVDTKSSCKNESSDKNFNVRVNGEFFPFTETCFKGMYHTYANSEKGNKHINQLFTDLTSIRIGPYVFSGRNFSSATKK